MLGNGFLVLFSLNPRHEPGKTIAIIPARGGSKGIPKKNLVDVCGKPLIAWTIEQALQSDSIDSVWVTSDDPEILSTAESFGANPIIRPEEISGDHASSESAWIHAVQEIDADCMNKIIVGLQPTSPLRQSHDIDAAMNIYLESNADSLLTVTPIEDYLVWRQPDDSASPVNYDYKNRRRRQDTERLLLENGSFYIFGSRLLCETSNRLGGKICTYEMERWQSFQIDSYQDLELCTAIMKHYITN